MICVTIDGVYGIRRQDRRVVVGKLSERSSRWNIGDDDRESGVELLASKLLKIPIGNQESRR